MPSGAAEATAAVVVEDLAVEEEAVGSAVEAAAGVHFGAVEAAGDSAAAVMAEAFAEDMAGTVDMAVSVAATGEALVSVGAGRGIGPVTRTDTLTIMDTPMLTDIPVTTDTIPMLTADSKHTDPMLLIRRHLLSTAAQ
jgi:hypothetical protein